MRKLGVTLIELLIVVALISLLALLAFSTFKLQIFKGKDARRKTDLHRLQIALEEFEKDNECYPTSLPACNPGDGLKPYLNKIPCDAGTKLDYSFYPDTSSPTCPKFYWIFANLDNMNDPVIQELGCSVNGCGPNSSLTDYNYYVRSPNAPNPSN